LEPQSAVEIEPQRPALLFTRGVRHAPPIPITVRCRL
jgi:hypothetical protein